MNIVRTHTVYFVCNVVFCWSSVCAPREIKVKLTSKNATVNFVLCVMQYTGFDLVTSWMLLYGLTAFVHTWCVHCAATAAAQCTMYWADDIVCMMVPLSSFVLLPARTPIFGSIGWPITAFSKLSIRCSSLWSVWLSAWGIFFTGTPDVATTITGLPSRVSTVGPSASCLQHKTHIQKTWDPVASRKF